MSQPLDYAPRPEPKAVTSVSLTIGLSISTAFMCFLGVLVAPQFEAILRDFKTELPFVTKLVLTISRWIGQDFGWLMIWAVPSAVPILVTQLLPKRPVRRSRRSRILMGIYIALPICGLISMIALAAFALPMMNMLHSVSRPAR